MERFRTRPPTGAGRPSLPPGRGVEGRPLERPRTHSKASRGTHEVPVPRRCGRRKGVSATDARLEEGPPRGGPRLSGPPDPVLPSRGSEEPRSRRERAAIAREDSANERTFLLPLPLPGGRACLYSISNAREREKSRSANKKMTTLSSGSLGSRVDEERSQLRDLV